MGLWQKGARRRECIGFVVLAAFRTLGLLVDGSRRPCPWVTEIRVVTPPPSTLSSTRLDHIGTRLQRYPLAEKEAALNKIEAEPASRAGGTVAMVAGGSLGSKRRRRGDRGGDRAVPEPRRVRSERPADGLKDRRPSSDPARRAIACSAHGIRLAAQAALRALHGCGVFETDHRFDCAAVAGGLGHGQRVVHGSSPASWLAGESRRRARVRAVVRASDAQGSTIE